MSKTSKHFLAAIFFFFLILIWGSSWPLNKIALSFTSATNYLEWRFLMGTLIMLLITLLNKNFIIPTIKDLPIIIAVGLFQIALVVNFGTYGLTHIDPGRASFINVSTSIWIIPLAACFHKRLHVLEIFAFCIGALGVLFLISPWQKGWLTDGTWIGDVILLCSSFSWAIGILAARHMKWHHTPLQLLPWQLLFGTLFTMGWAYLQGISFAPAEATRDFYLIVTITGGVGLGIGYWLMILVSKQFPPAVTSLGLLGSPTLALILSASFLNEPVSWTLIVAIGLLITGIALHIYSDNKKSKKKDTPPQNVP